MAKNVNQVAAFLSELYHENKLWNNVIFFMLKQKLIVDWNCLIKLKGDWNFLGENGQK